MKEVKAGYRSLFLQLKIDKSRRSRGRFAGKRSKARRLSTRQANGGRRAEVEIVLRANAFTDNAVLAWGL